MINTRKTVRPIQSHFNTISNIVIALIVLVMVVIVGAWIVAGVTAATAVSEISDKGLRGVAEQLWCGKSADCKLPQ